MFGSKNKPPPLSSLLSMLRTPTRQLSPSTPTTYSSRPLVTSSVHSSAADNTVTTSFSVASFESVGVSTCNMNRSILAASSTKGSSTPTTALPSTWTPRTKDGSVSVYRSRTSLSQLVQYDMHQSSAVGNVNQQQAQPYANAGWPEHQQDKVGTRPPN
ncbi:hypothetical protein K437DRAFT_87208 [Tilletiaria anomala UBC 951]|uniref:Uncharacterized protein n=1 Tax=Tilletiaria anomala (strain ATCC 24038 / CBS 436.72 / UBC 951) TaxID=1037660 RepID=A0A066WAR1_TILAU|nr:uncharacterized protein K437DRAFT_87208 [Tilletiaria anomala UBC 951]KDN48174.1 hypothetical protein K437DRAFT_87208 [Tilletiaria anomala UBC 951]